MATDGKLPVRGFGVSVPSLVLRGFDITPIVTPLPNSTPGTAIVMTLPFSVTVDLLEAFGTGAWYSYTPTAVQFLLGVQVTPNPPGVDDPEVLIYSDLSLTPAVPAFAQAQIPVQVPVMPGNTYYFSFGPTGGAPAPGTMATFTVVAAPNLAVPIGTFLVTDTKVGFPTILLRVSDHSVIRAVPLSVGEAGDILPSGVMCIETRSGPTTITDNTVYSRTFVTIAAVATSSPQLISADQVDTFYIGKRLAATSPVIISTISELGIAGGVTWTLPGDNLYAMSVSIAGQVLYWATDEEEATVQRYDLLGDAPLTDLAVGVAGFTIQQILVLFDDSILVSYVNSADHTTDFIRHYSIPGATLIDYAMSIYAETGLTQMARDGEGAITFWAWKETPGILSSTFTRIRITDGVVLDSLPIQNYIDGVGPDGAAQYFGPASGVLMIVPQMIIPPTPPPPIPPTTPAQWRLHRFDVKHRAEETS